MCNELHTDFVLKNKTVSTGCKCDLHSRYSLIFVIYLLAFDSDVQFLPASVAVVMLAKLQKSAYRLPAFEFKFFGKK